ncbi:MAG: bifunctional glutamate N-acetyltransferase/amino-acid acetyltransferase ArgJ [Spirochaetota bacterium]|nr:bifunctional glutamate N-acetyltransferase/amino-acid acetyltransferase ArgJ [Spirochaetota bacterium]
MSDKYPKGFIINGVMAGIKTAETFDMGIIYSKSPCQYAGMFTINKIQAAPVKICKERLNNPIHGVIVNSKNANSFTGKRGLNDAYKMTEIVERELNLKENSVLPSSTGVIGEYLPMEKIENGIKMLCNKVNHEENNPHFFAKSILTTDTTVKEISKEIEINGKKVRLYGACKGSGMIFPNMATMLAFIVSDMSISKTLLQKALENVVDCSFNSISVDGDMSTNDCIILLSNGEAGNIIIENEDQNYNLFVDALKEISVFLAKSIVRDGEGATKFIEICVKGALTNDDARKCTSHLANSLLVKTAFFGEDANWGRFIYAVGASGCEVDETKVDITLGDITLVKQGVRANFTEDQTSKYMKNHDLYLEINLNLGECSKTMYTCDLSYDYVKINASYRS